MIYWKTISRAKRANRRNKRNRPSQGEEKREDAEKRANVYQPMDSRRTRQDTDRVTRASRDRERGDKGIN